jgi:hypothetical protein
MLPLVGAEVEVEAEAEAEAYSPLALYSDDAVARIESCVMRLDPLS